MYSFGKASVKCHNDDEIFMYHYLETALEYIAKLIQ